MFAAITVGALVAALVTPMATTEPSPPPGRIVVDLVSVTGTGCPAGSAAITLSPDNSGFVVTFSRYSAQVGVGTSTMDYRKNCQLSISVHQPQGFSFALTQATYAGYAYLEKGAIATERSNYYFQGDKQTSAITHSFTGPFDDSWQLTDTIDAASQIYSPCGEQRALNINTELRIAAGTSDPRTTTSYITMDSTRTDSYQLAWRTCN
jgi:hypothetical protein